MGCACAQIVRSLAGHDRGGLFCVLDTDGPYLLLCDGKRRKLENPKRKKAVHTAPAGDFQHPVLDQLRTGGNLSNRDIRRALAALAKDDMIEVEGVVTESLPNTTFHVDIGNGHIILAHISGKLRMNFIRILPGDKVTVQMSPYDVTRGRITWRSK